MGKEARRVKGTTMVSVIVPVYNVEPYLNQCIDSILSQTYKDLEILLIDDGSTDRSGEICDSYTDPRITVFHTENRGLSAARNLGIDKAKGEYIYFIDSDDWIDSELIEKMVSSIASADILCLCHFDSTYTGGEALVALLEERISTFAWDKLYQKNSFSTIRFPEGRIIEDIATTYKILGQCETVKCADIHGYHHIFRSGSLCQKHDMKNLLDYYLAVTEQYDYCMDYFAGHKEVLKNHSMDELRIYLLRFRAYAISRAWAWRYVNPMSDPKVWEKMSYEARTLYPYNVRKNYSLRIRAGLFLARFNYFISYWIAYKLHVCTRKVPT